MTTQPLRAAIVGLGQAGWKLDQEPGRKVVWSHAGAYEALVPRVSIVGGCDIRPEAREEFSSRYRAVPVFHDVQQMISATDPHAISVCTPAETHRATIEAALSAPNLKAIWCEKPLATSISDAQSIVDACHRRGTALVINHVRRWSPIWRRFAQRLSSGDIGTLRQLRISMPNRLWSIGSHAVDLAVMLGGAVSKITCIDVPALAQDGEPARPALITFTSGASGVIEVTGLKSQLVVEAEAFGDRGRLRAREDRGEIAFEPFVPSPRYSGYFAPGPTTVEKAATLADESPFVAAAEEMLAIARDPSRRPTCSGHDALETMRILDFLAA